MQQILLAKAKCCQEFHDKLMNTEETFAEAVPNDPFWSTGLSKEVTMKKRVKKSSWPGKNRMGKLLSTVKEAIINTTVIDNLSIFCYNCCGLNGKDKRTKLFLWINDQNYDILLLQEFFFDK